MKKWVFLFLLIPYLLWAQSENDSVFMETAFPETKEGVTFSMPQLILPAALITAGTLLSIENSIDKEIRDNISWDKQKTHVDDFLPFVAPATVYVLNWSGVKGKHNFIDRSVILGTAAVLALGPTYLMKNTISTRRPDGKGDDSFPSFHTASAFVGAEFMWQEYKDQSFWLGMAGYGVATCTGVLRICNNKHWFSDVLVGAGFGIVGTKAAYWLYPEIRKWYKNTPLDRALLMPFGSKEGLGFSLSARF